MLGADEEPGDPHAQARLIGLLGFNIPNNAPCRSFAFSGPSLLIYLRKGSVTPMKDYLDSG